MTRVLISALLFTLAAPLHADVFAVKGGLSSWWPEGDGPGANGDTEQVFSASLALEHPVPIIPNFKLRVWDYSGETIGGVDLRAVDAILYYEIFDNDVVDLDLGVTATNYGNGRVGLNQEFEGWLPQVYGNLRIPITGDGTGLGLYSEATASQWDGNSTVDIEGGVDFKLDAPVLDVLIRAGYRHINNDFDDFDNFDGKLEFSGWTIGVIVDL